MSKDHFPKLEQFLGAYFHQDWALDDPTSAAVVNGFLRKAPTRAVKALVAELDRLQALKLREASLRKLIEGLGCCFEPESENRTYGQWISWLRTVLGESTSRP